MASIDGVLLRMAQPIPGATETLQYLQARNIPFLLLTNGGGRHEKVRVADLSNKLGVPLTMANFVQSHTPFQELVHGPAGLADKTVLVTGGDADRCRRIAKGYGFRRVVTPADILAATPDVFPFRKLLATHYASTSRKLPDTGGGPLKIDAILVFDDPRDWAVDTQLIVDLLLSRQGYLGSYSALNGDMTRPDRGWQADGQPDLYFSNGDLVWAARYALPRLGQGAFQAAVAGVWARVTSGHVLRCTVYGKPEAATFRFAERMLCEHRHSLLGRTSGALTRVYMVGDNPQSDIAGANTFCSEAGTEWVSVLVGTGVWNATRQADLTGVYAPTKIVSDVKEAVTYALGEEGWQGSI